MRPLLPLFLLFICLACPLLAQPSHVEKGLRIAAGQKYDLGDKWTEGRSNLVWYTIVPYKNIYFASTSGSDENGMDFYAIWEYLEDGKWHFIFQHSATNAGPEAHAEYDKIYAKHRFSPQMRKKLMRGPEKKF